MQAVLRAWQFHLNITHFTIITTSLNFYFTNLFQTDTIFVLQVFAFIIKTKQKNGAKKISIAWWMYCQWDMVFSLKLHIFVVNKGQTADLQWMKSMRVPLVVLWAYRSSFFQTQHVKISGETKVSEISLSFRLEIVTYGDSRNCQFCSFYPWFLITDSCESCLWIDVLVLIKL